jgi:mannose/cellobiose epimerase-like protein (N-acyl-D-glucosamine 2-epimerase family)
MTDTIYASVRWWLFEEALPFWAENGIDRVHGGYVEQLRLDGTDPAVDFKRTRVIGRQIYVFCHAALLGRDDGIALARHGYDFLTTKAWLGPVRGWARVLDRSGCVTDATPDLYDLAFILFGFGWFHRVTNDPEALAWALRTTDFIEREMRHPSGVGFLNQKPATHPRLQNPHMHLLEAALVNLEASGDLRFARLADEIVQLFCNRLFDPTTQTLAEYYDEDWTRMAGDLGHVIEPGHQFEWAWILAGFQRATGRDVGEWVRGLVEFAERHGVDRESGMTLNSVCDDGVALDRGSRVWPNTERIQAAVAMFELFGRDPQSVFEASGRVLMQRFLAHAPRGTWIDRCSPGGTLCVDKIPASTLYHLMIAFAEMLRVENAVACAFPT